MVLVLAIGMFASETIFGIFVATGAMKEQPHFGYVAILGVALVILAIGTSYFSVKASGNVQTITTILKFVPLVLVVVLGIGLAGTNHNPTLIDHPFGHNAFTNGHSFDFTKMLAALPAVLFAYDAFLVSSQLKNKMKNPKKLPLAISMGMITVIVLYCFIAIAAILHGSGMVSGKIIGKDVSEGYGIFDQIFTGKTAEVFGIVVIFFLAISTYGVLNGLSAGTLFTVMMMVETDTYFGTQKLKKKFGLEKSTLIYLAGGLFFIFLIVIIPATVFNNDAIVDAATNVPVLINFFIYALVILGYTLKRDKLNNEAKINTVVFKTFA